MKILADGLDYDLAHFKVNLKAAKELIKQGDSKADPKLNPVELAAYTVTASALLNLDETITKE